MANDVRWKSVALKADFVHLDRLPQMPVRVRNVNVTMPNALWGRIGDSHGKLRLLQSVGLLRLAPPLGMLAILMVDDLSAPEALWSFAALFFAIGALVNGMTIGYLGYLMEISPDDRRPAYSAYFNTLASPAALLPLVGALIADALSLNALFTVAAGAAILQLYFFKRLARWEDS
jgi:MFS family permease